MYTEIELQAKLDSLSNEELIKIADEELSKLCKTGGKSFRMCVPVMYNDTDVIFAELIKRFNQK